MAITDGLVGHWCPSLDDAGNGTTTLTDLSGNGNHGTLTNMDPATDWVADTSNGGVRALDFDGVDDYIAIADDASLDIISDFSLTAFVYPNVLSGYRRIIASNANEYSILLSNNRLTYQILNSGHLVVTSTVINDYIWNHVCVIFNNLLNTVYFYIDGVKDTVEDIRTDNPSVNTGATLGGRSLLTQQYDGKLDDMRIYNRALTPTEITALASQRGYTETTNAVPQFQRRMQAGGIL